MRYEPGRNGTAGNCRRPGVMQAHDAVGGVMDADREPAADELAAVRLRRGYGASASSTSSTTEGGATDRVKSGSWETAGRDLCVR
jgi:hypothetical protein